MPPIGLKLQRTCVKEVLFFWGGGGVAPPRWDGAWLIPPNPLLSTCVIIPNFVALRRTFGRRYRVKFLKCWALGCRPVARGVGDRQKYATPQATLGPVVKVRAGGAQPPAPI